MLTRRELMNRGALSVALICTPFDVDKKSKASSASGKAPVAIPGRFELPLRIPPVLEPRTRGGADLYEITMRKGVQEVIKGKETEVWGYDGMWPGPTIRARRDRPVHVQFTNDLEDAGNLVVHLHGANVPADSDGHPRDGIIEPSSSREHRYPNGQFAATHWYHDHVHGQTARNIYMGLSGFYLIEDPRERRLRLPRGDFDVPLMIQDRRFKPDGSFVFDGRDFVPLGDEMIVNGTQQPYFEVARRKYLFRILNASAAREYQLELDSGKPLVQVGNDGGLLPEPVTVSKLPIVQAERADVVIDFSEYPIDSSVILRNTPTAGPPLGIPLDVMRFDVVREAEDDSAVPGTLRPVPLLRREDAVETREVLLDFDPIKRQWQINHQPFDPDRVDFSPRLGTVELWKVTTGFPPLVGHPFHMHLVRFQVLTRNGDSDRVSGGEKGLKDTVRVGSDEPVELITRFGDYRGRYVFHCHNLLHSENAMMATMEVI